MIDPHPIALWGQKTLTRLGRCFNLWRHVTQSGGTTCAQAAHNLCTVGSLARKFESVNARAAKVADPHLVRTMPLKRRYGLVNVAGQRSASYVR